MPFVLDASVALSWCFEDEPTSETEAILDRFDSDHALVPTVWGLEVANALLTAERHQRLQVAEATHFSALLLELSISVVPMDLGHTFGAVLGLARTHGLTSYDASYIALAMREGVPLATQDRGLRRVAKQLGVLLLPE
ncbi:MAG: type II toxin-antitoxin system VapC family toxin [Chloroflexota bacterium]